MSNASRVPFIHRARAGFVGVAAALALVATGGGASADTFLDDVDHGRAAVAASGAAALTGSAARAAAVQNVVAAREQPSIGFTLGANLAALDLDLASDPKSGTRGDRAVVEQQVRDLLAAQADTKIGNRALCLLSGRSQPKTLEKQIRLVEPRWTCEKH